MPTEFVKILYEYNPSTYFLLPLIGLNRSKFYFSNFINCYVNRSGTILTVRLVDLRLSLSFKSHPEYLGERAYENFAHIWFSLPEKWEEDFQRYCRGEWSRLSEDAKELIKIYSGLRYKELDDHGIIVTDARLLALEKSSILKKKWEEELGLNERGNEPLPLDIELLSKPSEESFLEVDL